jgi:hypothetical protein
MQLRTGVIGQVRRRHDQRCADIGATDVPLDGKSPIEYSAIMILDERSAAIFISDHQKLLLEIGGPPGGNVKLLERPVEGRKGYQLRLKRRQLRVWRHLWKPGNARIGLIPRMGTAGVNTHARSDLRRII